MNQLTPKQQAFVDAILAGNHPNEAAKKAGYKYAAQAALTLSKTPAVMEAIKQGQKKSSGIIQDEQARKAEAIMEEAQLDHEAAKPAQGTDALRTALREIIGDTLDEKRVTEIVRAVVKQEVGLAPVRVEIRFEK